jgi:hypothetical protein
LELRPFEAGFAEIGANWLISEIADNLRLRDAAEGGSGDFI